MMKRLIASVLMCAMLISVFPAEVLATEMEPEAVDLTSEPETEEVPEEEPEEELEEEPVVLFGEEEDFSYSVLNGTYCMLTGYNGTATEVTVPYELGGHIVQSIDTYVFRGNKTVEAIVLPETLESLGDYAFNGCTSLTSVQLHDSLSVVGSGLFSGCVSLEEIELPDGITSIGERAFEGCTALKQITLPEAVKSVGSNAFYGCTNLTEVSLPEGLTSIGAYAFRDCDSLETIDFPDSLTSLAGRAFYNCDKLAEVGYPKGLTAVPEYAYNGWESPFTGCVSLKTIEIPEGVTVIPAHMFRDQTSLEEVVLPESLTGIGAYAFHGCTALKAISLLEGLTTIDAYAFHYCIGLTELSFPESLTDVGTCAFQFCTGLEQVTTPENLTVLPEYMFNECTALTSVTVSDAVTRISAYAFHGCTALTQVELPEGLTTIEGYAFRDCDGLEAIDLPDSLTGLAGRAFYNCDKLAEVGYPKGLTEILSYAYNAWESPFTGCTNLKKVEIPEGVTEIPAHTFRNQTSLEEVVLPESLTTIGAYAFDGCGALKTLTFNNGLTTIRECAFRNCKALTELTLPEGVITVENYAFEACTGIRSLTTPATLTVIQEGVFQNCTGLTEVTLAEGLKSIEIYAFRDCGSLQKLDIPDSVTSLTGRAFYNCGRLAEVGYPKGLTEIPNYAYNSWESPFIGCTALKKVEIPEGVTEIPAYTFRNQTSLEEVVLPESLTTMGSYVFDGCAALRAINLVNGLTVIPHCAFRNCFSLSELELPETLETIDSYAFYGCTGLRLLNFNKNLISIGEYAFYGCYGLVSLRLNDLLVTISAYAFGDCGNLTAASVPKSVTAFDARSFSGCPKITVYCYSGSAAHMALDKTGTSIFLLDDHEHDYTTTIDTQMTCTKEGSQIQTCTICGYNYTELVPALGHDYQDTLYLPTCTKEGYTEHICSRCEEGYRDSYVEATGHFFGDWMVVKQPTPIAKGLAYRICAGCESREEKALDEIELTEDFGYAKFTVVNAQTLEPIANASIFVANEDGSEEGRTYATDEHGQVSIVMPVGKQKVSAYASGCLSRTLTVNVKPGETEIPAIGLSDKPTYEASVTSHRMTYEEIIAAGIDVNAAENQHVYKYELKLVFEPEIDVLSLIYYMGDFGFMFGGIGNWDGGWNGPPGDDGDTGEGDGTGRPVYWIWDEGDSSTGGKGHFLIPGLTPEEEDTSVYVVSERFYLIIRGEVRWLKEMFDVEMLVVNNSMTDTMEDMTATLNLPVGLSLAAMVGEPQTLRQEIGSIPGGESKSIHWYVRGDTAGSYGVTARLQGMLMPFEEVIDDYYEGQNQIHVWAGNALRLHFEFPSSTYYNDDYPIRITLTNVSDIPLYNLSHKVQIVQGMEYYYSDGTSDKRIETSQWYSSGVLREFRPGDQIIIEGTVNIFFKSKKIQEKLDEMTEFVDGIEQMINGFKAIEAAFDATEALTNCLTGCSSAIDKFDFNSVNESDEKMKLFKELHEKLSGLMSSYSTSGNKTIDAAGKLANTGLNVALNAITTDPGEWLKNHSVSDIKDLLDSVESLGKEFSGSGGEDYKFNVFDSIRTAISAIPVRFVLKGVFMEEDEGNTTRIPWSYSTTAGSAQYFGVSNVSKYILSIIQRQFAEIYEDNMPELLQLIPGLDDPFHKDEAEQYIQATEQEIEKFQARAASGSTRFTVRIVRNQAGPALMASGEQDFELSCDNETAVYEDGVLTFTGDGMINVKPLSGADGTLYIEDSDGHQYIYQIDVVPQHDCVSGERNVIITPTEDYDGFAVRTCVTCGEVMEIIPLLCEEVCEEHSFGQWTVETEATEETGGLESRTCTACGFVEYQFTEKLANWLDLTVTEKTDTTVTVAVSNQSGQRLSGNFVLAAYQADGRMVSCEMKLQELGDKGSFALSVDFAAEDMPTEVRVFLLDSETMTPGSRAETAELR